MNDCKLVRPIETLFLTINNLQNQNLSRPSWMVLKLQALDIRGSNTLGIILIL